LREFSIWQATEFDKVGILDCLHAAFEDYRGGYTSGAYLVAARLLSAVEGELRQKKCRRVTLDTTAQLKRAMRFYEKSGFRRSGRVRDFFGMPLFDYVKAIMD